MSLPEIEEHEGRPGGEPFVLSDRLRSLLDAVSDGVYIIDRDWRYVLVNERAAELVQTPREQLLGRRVTDLFPQIAETPFYQAYAEAMSSDKKVSVAEQFRFRDGRQGWYGVSVYPVPEGILCIAADITERKEAEDTLRLRLAYERGIAQCSQILVEDSEPTETINSVLSVLLRISRAGRVYLFQNVFDADQRLCMSQTHEVCAEGVSAEIDNPTLKRLPYSRGYTRWRTELENGRPVSGPVEGFPAEERSLLEEQGILSVLVLPIRVQGSWAGFIGFDDTVERRSWKKHDVLLLRAVAQMIGSYISRRRMEDDREALIGRLQKALAEIKTLTGLLPICANCKRIRDDRGYWQQIEVYFREHSDLDFSHGLCPDCLNAYYNQYMDDGDPDE